jgi:hypothetical protein
MALQPRLATKTQTAMQCQWAGSVLADTVNGTDGFIKCFHQVWISAGEVLVLYAIVERDNQPHI